MQEPTLRWNAGLERMGLAWRTSNSRSMYPPLTPSYPHRTYQFADQSDYEIDDPGRHMTFGSTFYAPFILFGTSRWAGWPGHFERSLDMMRQAFIDGVVEYSS